MSSPIVSWDEIIAPTKTEGKQVQFEDVVHKKRRKRLSNGISLSKFNSRSSFTELTTADLESEYKPNESYSLKKAISQLFYHSLKSQSKAEVFIQEIKPTIL